MAFVLGAYSHAGFDSAQWGYRHASGWMAGAANLTSANTGTSSNMAHLMGVTDFPFSLPDQNVVAIPGDNTIIAQFLFGANAPLTFNFTSSVYDPTFRAAAENLATYDEGERQFSPITMDAVSRNPLILLFTADAEGIEDGQKAYVHVELFNCQVAWKGHAFAHQAPGTSNWQIVANASATLPNGVTMATEHADAPNGRLIGRAFVSRYRFSYSTLIGNNSLVKVVTSHNPVSTAKSRLLIETTGFASDTVASIVTSAPYGVNATTTPGSGKALIAEYEFINYAS